jgi:hypothetical protein
MALKTVQCYGNASSLKQRSALKAIHTLNPPKIISASLGASLGVVVHPFDALARSARPHVEC